MKLHNIEDGISFKNNCLQPLNDAKNIEIQVDRYYIRDLRFVLQETV